LAAIGIAAATVVVFALPAAADDPPDFIAPPADSNLWVGFTVSGLPLSVSGRSTVPPVTLTRVGNMTTADLKIAFPTWPTQPDPPNPEQTGWPTTFNVGSVQLERVAWCPYDIDHCDYKVLHGGTFDIHGGTLVDPSTNAPVDTPFPSSLVIPDPPPAKVLHVGFSPDLNPTPGGVGQPGHVTLDATTFTSDELDPGGALAYHWVVVNIADPTKTFSSDIGPKVQLDINQDGTYCVQLTVTAAVDGFSSSTQSCDATTRTGAPTFIAKNFAPQTPHSSPPPNPTPPAGGGGTSGGGGFGGITFSNPPRRAPAVLSSAGLSSPAVVWLWRPDFYKPTPAASSGAPITTNTPNLKGRHEIVVTRPGPDGASAGPWLAGMGAFGIAGGGWVVSRRRRLRLLDLEP